jgi:hypothetical protein
MLESIGIEDGMADLRVDGAIAIMSEGVIDDFVDNGWSGEGSFEEVLAERVRDAFFGIGTEAVPEERVELMPLESCEDTQFFDASFEREEGRRVEVTSESWETGEDDGEERCVFELGLSDHADFL